MPDNKEEGLRVDRWLWFTRFYKTRTLASAAVRAGHVRINGARTKPGDRVVSGDTVELVRNQLLFRLLVVSLPVHRKSPALARECYEEHATTERERLDLMAQIKEDRRRMPRTRGKPDKHTRRLLRERNRRQTDRAG